MKIILQNKPPNLFLHLGLKWPTTPVLQAHLRLPKLLPPPLNWISVVEHY